MGIVLLFAALGLLALASRDQGGSSVYGQVRLASDGKHNQWTEAGRDWAYSRLKDLKPGPTPSWLTPAEAANPTRAVLTLVPAGQGNAFGGSANDYIVLMLKKMPAGSAAWTDATLTELAFTTTDEPPLNVLSAKFNLLTKSEWGWPVPKGKVA